MDKIRVLLVDDNKKRIDSLKVIFSNDGYIIHIANSGKHCLEKLLNERIDTVLMEANLKDLNGFNTSKLIRSNPKISHIPVILLSDEKESKEYILQAYDYGAFEIEFRPFTEEVLLHKINIFHEMIYTRRELEEQVKVLTKLNEQNFEMRKQIEKIASIDYLTEVANRRGLDRELSNEYILALQDKKYLSLLMMDLDNFKKYNDYFGHQRGDRALRAIAKATKKATKDNDALIGRYGGEEFLIVIKNSDNASTKKIANKILESINKLAIKHSPVCENEYLTVSIGAVSAIPSRNTSVGKLISFADEALYEAKNQGKNRYVIKKI